MNKSVQWCRIWPGWHIPSALGDRVFKKKIFKTKNFNWTADLPIKMKMIGNL
jgi:hypothetical protein